MNRVAASNAADSANAQAAGNASSSNASAGQVSNQGGNLNGRTGALLGAGVDWFSQLDTGTAHPMKAGNQFGSNPPIDTIVDKIMNNLGLPPLTD